MIAALPVDVLQPAANAPILTSVITDYMKVAHFPLESPELIFRSTTITLPPISSIGQISVVT